MELPYTKTRRLKQYTRKQVGCDGDGCGGRVVGVA